MRRFLAVALCVAASPALADRIEVQPRTDHVTVFPQGATIRWRADLTDAPQGRHELILPGLPQGMDAAALRITAEGATIGSVSLQTSRPQPGSSAESPAVITARKQLQAARDALTGFEQDIARHRADAASWRERAGMVRDMMRGDTRVTADRLQAEADQAGGMIADYLARASDAERDAALMENRREPLEREVQQAQEVLAAVLNDTAHETLVVAIEKTGDDAHLSLSGFTTQAGWSPDYDLRLDRDSGQIAMQRGLVITQSSGVDWQDVALTLSTARPSDQISPTEVPVWMPGLYDPAAAMRIQDAPAPMAMAEAYVADAAPSLAGAAVLANIGMTVTYDYPGPVTIRDGADASRLRLDDKLLQAEVLAEAAPRFDDTAFVVAETENSLDEPILPGQATLYLDGAMIGQTRLELTAPGDDLDLAFGPIDGITAELRVPEDEQGERGLIRRSNEQTLTEVLILRNLTGEDWPLRVVDRVPVSRQSDLTVDWSADPQPSETDPDGRRGVLYWQDVLAAGDSREITLTTQMRWPEGKELQR